MTRPITAAAATEGAKVTGAFPRLILQVNWTGTTGTKFYAEEALTSPVIAEGRILKFGQSSLEMRGGRIDQQASMPIKISDVDGVIRGLMNTSPGVQSKNAFVYLFYEGTTWPDDAVTIFGGVLTTPMSWRENDPAWDLVIRGFEQHFNRDLGFVMNRIDFPEVDCSQCEGEIIPIAYGRPVRRVPACVIDRPGQGYLIQTLPFCGSNQELCLNVTCAQGGFDCGPTITVIVGWPTFWEAITGFFTGPDDNCLTITGRGSVLAAGNIVGFFGSGGIQYIMIEGSDLPDYTEPPPDAESRVGHPICFQEQDGSFKMLMVSMWTFRGDNIVVIEKGDLDVVTGSGWKIGRWPGIVPHWPPGTPVGEKGDWTYAINFYPIESVERVEARASVQQPGGGSGYVWAQYNRSFYSVNVDDKSFNGVLGRGALEPGIATVTTAFAPTQAGFEEENVWVTMNGINEVVGGPAIENPAMVMLDIITKKYLGGILPPFVRDSSFLTAALEIPTRFAFALLERTELHNVISDLATQATLIYFWDQGKAQVKKLEIVLEVADSVITITESNREMGSFVMEEIDVKQFTTEMEGRFKLAIPSPQIKLARKSSDAIIAYGNKRDELDLWAYQAASSVAFVTEFYLSFRLHNNRTLKCTTFLNGLQLQPGDTITWDIKDGESNQIINVLGRVRSVSHHPGNPERGEMERIDLSADVRLFSFQIQVNVPADDTCDQVAGLFFGSAGPNFQKLYVRSDGVHTMYVLAPGFAEIAGGGSNLNNPVETETDGNAPGFPPAFPVVPFPPRPLPPIDPDPPFDSGSFSVGSDFEPPSLSASISPPPPLFSSTLTTTRSLTDTGTPPCDCGLDTFTDVDDRNLCGAGAGFGNPHQPEVGTWCCECDWASGSAGCGTPGKINSQFTIFQNRARLNCGRGIELMGCGSSDVTVSLNVCMPIEGSDPFEGTAIGGVAFRMSGCGEALTGWGALLISDGRNSFRLYRFNADGTWTEIARCSMPVENGSCYEVTVVACGSSIYATARGPSGGCELIVDDDFNINASKHGMMGIQDGDPNTDWTRMSFDDFCITKSCESGTASISPSEFSANTLTDSISFGSGSEGGCGTCQFTWNGVNWIPSAFACCPLWDCSEPFGDGDFIGEIRVVPCTIEPI